MDYERPLKRKANIHNLIIWLAALAFLFIYFVGYLYSYVNRQRVSTGEVVIGEAEDAYTLGAVCSRFEDVYFAGAAGVVSPIKEGGERVRKFGAVCAIMDKAAVTEIEDGLLKVDEAILKNLDTAKNPFAADIAALDAGAAGEVYALAATISGGRFSNIYQLKERLNHILDARRQVLSFGAQTDAKQLARERSLIESRLEAAKKVIYAAGGGVVSYYIDGAESFYEPKRVIESGSEFIRFNTAASGDADGLAETVGANAPVCKIVTSNTWYIAAFCEDKAAAGDWAAGREASFTADCPDLTVPVELTARVLKIEEKDGGVYALFELDTNMEDFINCRGINLFVSRNKAEGLKVPVSAVARKTLLSIPKVFTFERDSQTYVTKLYKQTNEKSGKANTDKTDTVITVTDESEDGDILYIIADYNDVRFMDTLVNEAGQTFLIETADTIEGVFIANTGAPAFRPIKRMEGERGKDYGGYIILEPERNPRIKAYDRIVLEAGRLDDKRMVY